VPTLKGEPPDPEEAERGVVEVRAPDFIAELRATMRLLRLLPDEVVAASTRGRGVPAGGPGRAGGRRALGGPLTAGDAPRGCGARR
jgi:hypothetical protein